VDDPAAVGAAEVTEAAGLDGAAGLDAPDGDGVADADDATARTMLVRPLKIRKKPVARIRVAGRTCLDRMGRPSIDAVVAEIVLSGIFGTFGATDCSGATPVTQNPLMA
jgi:hypothetical protein